MRRPIQRQLRALLGLTTVAWVAGSSGCAGPWPKLFPIAPVRMAERAEGAIQRWYDVDRDGKADYCEVIDAGRVDRIGYDRDQDGRIDEEIDLARIPSAEQRHLLIILDSVPVGMVREFQTHGRLLFFHRPAQVLSPFPVMTDPVLATFFGMTPAPVVEAAHFDGERLRDGYQVYVSNGNTPWHARADYVLAPVMHAAAYLSQPEWFGHELRRIGEVFAERFTRGERMTVTYLVGTSALGSRRGRDGHALALVSMDRFCQQLVYETRGRARITLMSDHGHAMLPSERIPLADELGGLGYRVGSRLERPGDVVVPEFGVVSCAAIHTREPARVAGDVVRIRGIELAAYLDRRPDGAERVVVLSKVGRASLTRAEAGFRYEPEVGDPLRMADVLARLRDRGKLDADGFVADRVLFEATIDSVYPDAVARLWRAFHGLFVHQPDVFVSVEDGFEVGSKLQTQLVHMQATHGNLRAGSSWGFAASMAGPLPPVLRMADLREAMRKAGVPVDK